jgi:hypothetical protein
MAYDSDTLDEILALIKQMDSALLGFRQLRAYIQPGAALHQLDQLIEELEVNLAKVKRRLLQ